MGKMKTLLKLMKSERKKIPEAAVNNLTKYGLLNWISDTAFLKLKFRTSLHQKLNLSNPRSFNEKLQWLKLYDRKPEYTMMVDKYRVREYIAETIGEEYLIPLLGVWENPEEIEFDALPNQFVLKCNHDSGSVILCRDKITFDIEAAKKKLRKHMKQNLFWWGREWPYKNVPRKIIAEKYMVDESGAELKDYKVFCFNGIPKLIEVDFDRFTSHKRNIYDVDWNLTELEIQYPRDTRRIINKPEQLENILNLSCLLSRNKPHLRVDWYVCGEKIFLGELTFFHEAGFGKFKPDEWDYKLGEWIDLSKVQQ